MLEVFKKGFFFFNTIYVWIVFKSLKGIVKILPPHNAFTLLFYKKLNIKHNIVQLSI